MQLATRWPIIGSPDSSSISLPSMRSIWCLIIEFNISERSIGFFQLSTSYFCAPYSRTWGKASSDGKWTILHFGFPSLNLRALVVICFQKKLRIEILVLFLFDYIPDSLHFVHTLGITPSFYCCEGHILVLGDVLEGEISVIDTLDIRVPLHEFLYRREWY